MKIWLTFSEKKMPENAAVNKADRRWMLPAQHVYL